jgi:hypothetical protein
MYIHSFIHSFIHYFNPCHSLYHPIPFLNDVVAQGRGGLRAHQAAHIGHVPGWKGVEVTKSGGAQTRGQDLRVHAVESEVLLGGLLLLHRHHSALLLVVVVAEQNIAGLQGVGQLEALGGGHEMGVRHAHSLVARGGDDHTLGGGCVRHGALDLLASLELLIGVLHSLVVDDGVNMEASSGVIIIIIVISEATVTYSSAGEKSRGGVYDAVCVLLSTWRVLGVMKLPAVFRAFA